MAARDKPWRKDKRWLACQAELKRLYRVSLARCPAVPNPAIQAQWASIDASLTPEGRAAHRAMAAIIAEYRT